MRRLLWLLLLLVLVPHDAHAQASVALFCWNPSGSQATNNQYVPCQASNPLQVSSSGGGLASNITQWASTNLGAPTGWGVAPSGNVIPVNANIVAPVGQAAMAASIPVAIANNQSAVPVNAQPTPVTSGGLSLYNVQPTAGDNHANIKNGAGQVYKIEAFNNSATINYVRLYNAGTGFNGCGSATNLVGQWIIPASTSGAGLSSSYESGIAFATGISICVTSGYATNDTTNATATALIVNVGYK